MPLKLSIFNKNYRLNIDFVRIEMSQLGDYDTNIRT